MRFWVEVSSSDFSLRFSASSYDKDHALTKYCCNVSVDVVLNVSWIGCAWRITHIYSYVAQTNNEWSRWVIIIVLLYLPLWLSDRNKLALWPWWCEGRARCSLHEKNVRSVQFAVKRKGCCCNLSVDVVLNVWFTMNGMCAKNKTHMEWKHNNRVVSSGDLYCCLLPQCESLCACQSGFLIATVSSLSLDQFYQLGSPNSKITLAMLSPLVAK